MHLTTILRRRMLAGLVAATGLVTSPAAMAQAPAPAPAPAAAGKTSKDAGEVKIGKLGELVVPLGGLAMFDPKIDRTITDVEVSNQDVLDVKVAAPDLKKIELVGKLGGASKMTVVFADRSKATYTIIVQPDYEQLKYVLKRTVPTANIEVIPGVGNVIILSGSVTKPEDSDTAVKIASSAVGGQTTNVINALTIGGSQHVMIEVTVAQVDRTELRERGFAFGVFGKTVTASSVLGGLASLPQAGGGAGGSPLLIGSANIAFSIVPAQFIGALRALRTESLAKFLSEPKLTTMSGKPAFFRAGGRQAVLGAASGINGPGVLLEPVGTELEVLPIVRGDGKINLEVNPRITTVNAGKGITTSFGFSTGFNEQQTRTSVVLEPGQTFAIAGLIESSVQGSAEKVPYLGDMPLVGAAFSNVRYEERETELLILVTPRLQDAMNCDQVGGRVPGKETRSPDDYELFLESLIEAPRGQRQPWGGGRGNGYKAAWKCNPAGFPCQNNMCGPNCQQPAGHAGTCATGNSAPALPVATMTAAPIGTATVPQTQQQPVSPAGGFEPVSSPVQAPIPVPVNGGGTSER
jgi:pilus assembly protein CpaC